MQIDSIQNNNYNRISFEQKYRVILTMKCPRACKDCINTFEPVIKKAEKVKLENIISDGDDIVLTGGEPAILLSLKQVVQKIRSLNPTSKIFVYSAKANQNLFDVLQDVNGLSFTLHDTATKKDISEFLNLQKHIAKVKKSNPSNSYRLYIDGRLHKSVPIKPNLYSRIDIIKWMNEEEILARKDRNFGCPADEKLVILDI